MRVIVCLGKFNMKILSWNIWDGGVSKKNYKDGRPRINDIAKAILSHDPDVAVITEYKNNDLGRDLKNSLLCDIPSTFQYHLIKENHSIE